jgi:biofilm protein TabA
MMIFGNLSDLARGKMVASFGLKRAFEYINETDFSRLSDGKHLIEGEEIFVNIATYDTRPREENEAESHRKYVDVQYIISGEEVIGFGKDNPRNEILKPYNVKGDYTLYGEITDESFVIMKEGDCAVFLPSDIHRPGCNYNGKSNVRKAVVKILLPSM